MFGISFAELLVVIIFLLTITKPKDIPQIAQYLTKIFYKIKYFLLAAKKEAKKISHDIGFEEVKDKVTKEIEEERRELRKTTIIDIYGNEHEVHDIEQIRKDLSKEDLEDEIARYNEENRSK